ncbi:uncharacterized protein CANTADRAFT_6394 [Suhomyces tanzawaensis NRRL Y-17324]|uniref:Peptidyl-prolyl cis-trans isomerase n=1 Tax=Suhomyces tanzawaensis NRRL Y-17324 TaxID=984487 RepID=A0A1E4SIA5_9ASCO|nr:uncharacterized protein CANTADRAFT_6394 [Suhomyces tanzawaensis NRRL Y-17324]ODV79236.1 hypothetical protein CANTADRAFT_6394 [Suhomyces tanzawaensis NRRL Y-17324]
MTETNRIVFLDVSNGSDLSGRIKIELFEGLPRTTENFRQFCTGEYRENRRPVGYKNAPFHRIIKGFMIQGGDFVRGNGSGSTSIHGRQYFDDEGFTYDHKKYTVSMANSGPNTNGCQFFVCCRDVPELDGRHVVFGRVVEGFDIVDRIEAAAVDKEDRPRQEIKIVDCGEM